MRCDTLTVIIRDDNPCASYGGPAKYRTVHVELTLQQIQHICLLSNEDPEKAYLEDSERLSGAKS